MTVRAGGRSALLGVFVVVLSLTAGCTASPAPNIEIGNWAQPAPSTEGTLTLPTPAHLYAAAKSPDRVDVTPTPTATPPGVTSAPSGSGYDRYLTQRVKWGSCTTPSVGTKCAHVLAPLDWQVPDGPAITLTMKRKSATSKLSDATSPDLFVNPGGPGGSAQDYVDEVNTKGLTGFNIVGLDPRGSGESTPVVCGSTSQLDAYFAQNVVPSNDQEKQALIDANRQFAQQCRNNSGALLDHISTIEAVYDFDLVRQLLGDAKFNWLGVSYGTFIGAIYLELYPKNAGRMILDAAVNIVHTSSSDSADNSSGVSQSDGFDLALSKFAAWEVSKGKAASVSSFDKKLTTFIDSLKDKPIKVGNRMLTQSLFVTAVALFMYLGTSGYAQLADGLDQTMNHRDGAMMLAAADSMNGRTNKGYDSMATAFPAIYCKDQGDNGIDAMYKIWLSDAKSAPIFGKYFGPDLQCPVWTVQAAPSIKFSGAGDPPFLVIGGTGDNATPYQYAQSMAKQMPSAILVTRDGVGHGSYSSGSSCIDKIVRDFLNRGTTPKDGVTCQMD